MTEAQFHLSYRVVVDGDQLSIFNDMRVIKACVKREWITPELQVTRRGILAAMNVANTYYTNADTMVEALRSKLHA